MQQIRANLALENFAQRTGICYQIGHQPSFHCIKITYNFFTFTS